MAAGLSALWLWRVDFSARSQRPAARAAWPTPVQWRLLAVAAAGNAVLRESNLAADAVVERVLTLRAAAAGMYLVQLSVRNDVAGGGGASGGNSLFALPVLVEAAPVSAK